MPVLQLTYRNRNYRVTPDNTPFTMGRLPENDLCLEYEFVSGKHGRIIMENNGFVYEDTSTNGTGIRFQNGAEEFIRNSGMPLEDSGFILFGTKSESKVSFNVIDSIQKGELEDESMLEKGLAFLNAKDYNRAFNLFEELIRQRPDILIVYYYAGFAASKLKNYKTAILRFEQYLMLRPGDMEIGMDLGMVYEADGDTEKALNCYRKILAADPDYGKAKEKLNEFARFQTSISPPSRNKKTREILKDYKIQKIEGDHFRVTYIPAVHLDILKDILKTLETARRNVGRILGFFPSEMIPVTLSEPHKDVSGRTGPDGIVMEIDQKHLGEMLFLFVLVVHEYAHYALGSLTGFSKSIPWWLQEGFAQNVSQNITPNRLIHIKQMAQKEKLIPLAALEKGPGDITDRKVIDISYLEAHSAMAFLIKRHGYDGLQRLIKALNHGQNIKKGFGCMGQEYEQFEMEWKKWLAKSVESGTVKLTREINVHRRDAENAEGK